MIQRILPFLFVLAFLSCSSDPEPVPAKEEPVEEELSDEEIIEEDTNYTDYKLGAFTIRIRDLDSTETIGGSNWRPPTKTQFELLDKYAAFDRRGDTLLVTSGSKVLQLIDVPYEETPEGINIEENVEYRIVEKQRNKNWWEIGAHCYEYFYNVMVHKETGDTINMIGSGIESPSGKQIMAWNFDLEAGFTPNGIELIEISDGSHKSHGTLLFDDFGIDGVEWVTENKLIMKKAVFTEDWKLRYSFVSVELIRK